ncbi:MAG: PAS domain S-box protein [Rhodospirillaceae bacterium]
MVADATSARASDKPVGNPSFHRLRWMMGAFATVGLAGLAALVVGGGLGDGGALGSWRETWTERLFDLLVIWLTLGGLTGLMLRKLIRLQTLSADLRVSEQRLRRMVESLPAGAVHVENGHLTLNRLAEEITGYPRHELPSLDSWFVTLHPGQGETVRRIYFAALATGFRQPIVVPLVRKDGVSRTVEFAVYGTAEEAVWLLHDITDRLVAEQELRASSGRLSALLGTLPDTVFILDADGRYLEVIRRDRADRAAVLGKRLNEILPAAVAERLLATIRRTIETGLSQSVDYHLGDGGDEAWYEGRTAALPFDFGPRPAVLLSVRDITPRHRVEQALRHSEARYALAVHGARDVVWDWTLDSNEMFFSRSWAALLGYDEGELPPGRAGWEAAVPAGERDRVAAALEVCRRSGAATLEIGYQALSKTGEPRSLLARGQVLRGADGRPCRLTGTLADVTETRRAEEQLRRAKEIAERASEAKSQFLANMSHELRTPLNAIIGFSEILSRGGEGAPGRDRTHEYAGYILSSGAHLLDLINDLLDMSRLEAGLYRLEEEEINLSQIFESGLAAVGTRAAEAGLSLDCRSGPEPLPLLWGDRRALQQVLLNLLSNAIKFTPPGGRVILAGGCSADGGLIVTLEDSGMGIEAAALGRVMEPFQQADMTISRKFGGSGLGLAISRNLIQLHGGTLTLASTPGVGTIATITLPPERVIGGLTPPLPAPAGAAAAA